MTLSRELENPLRFPDESSGEFMTKRAWWLIVLGFLLPGSAQVLAGNRRLGRFGLGATVCLFVFVLVIVGGLFFARTFTLTVLTNSIFLFALQVLIVAYAVLWLVLGFDTLRGTRIGRIFAKSRVPVAGLSVILTVLPVSGALWMANTVGAGRAALSEIFSSQLAAVPPVDGRYNILLLGADAGDGRDGLRPDSISLVSIDADSGESLIVGLPRELEWVPFPVWSPMHSLHPNGYGYDWGCDASVCYLNSIYTEINVLNPDLYDGYLQPGENPGIVAMKEAVTGATGLEVQFFVLIDMAGFARLIDSLGGVDIYVAETLPIGGDAEGNNIEGWIEPGLQHMDGYTAEWYARSRYTTDDYDRMRRQRELQRAILGQMTPVNVLQRFQEIAGAGSYLVWTDIPEGMLGRFVELAAKAKDYDPVAVEIAPPLVNPEYPDYGLIHELVREGVVATTPVTDESGDLEG